MSPLKPVVTKTKGLALGRIVRYVALGGSVAPAMIVGIPDAANALVNLQVFNDCASHPVDGPDQSFAVQAITYQRNVPFVELVDPASPEPGTWHWPPREA